MNRLKHILCPVDFSEASYQAMEKASFFAQLYQADLTLLHVIHVLPQSFGVVYGLDMSTNAMVEKATENARVLLREAKQKYVPYAVKCKSSIRIGYPPEMIMEEAATTGADLIVLNLPATAGNGAFPEETDQVLAQAQCPVIAFHAHKPDGLESRMGFKKILVPLSRTTPLQAIYQYLDRYLSITGSDILLIGSLPADASDLRKNDYEQFLKQVTGEWSSKGLGKVNFTLKSGPDPSAEIQKTGLSMGCDLMLIHANDIQDKKWIVNGSSAHQGNLIYHSPIPVMVLQKTEGERMA
ncbi:MAG: universal stress protein [Bacteroidia bacterium]